MLNLATKQDWLPRTTQLLQQLPDHSNHEVLFWSMGETFISFGYIHDSLKTVSACGIKRLEKKTSEQRSEQEHISLDISKWIRKFCTKITAWNTKVIMENEHEHYVRYFWPPWLEELFLTVLQCLQRCIPSHWGCGSMGLGQGPKPI